MPVHARDRDDSFSPPIPGGYSAQREDLPGTACGVGRRTDLMRVLVTGGGGFLGRAIVSRLVYTISPSVIFSGRDMEGVDESVPYPKSYSAEYPRTKALAEQCLLA